MSALLQELHQKNMNFFATHYPAIHQKLIGIDHSEYEILIDSDRGDVDVRVKGQLYYSGSAMKEVELEYSDFLFRSGVGKRQVSMERLRPGDFNLPRTAHQFIDRLVARHSDPAKDEKSDWQVPAFYPQVVVLGVGLGLHITNLLDQHIIHSLVVYESDLAMILMSTFVTDWEELFKKQYGEGRSLTILNIDIEEGDKQIWNFLQNTAPHFPLCTIFYNHNQNKDTYKIAQSIISQRHLFMPSWGQYDDEINQTNHIIRNLQKSLRVIPEKNSFKINKPVIVVGSGPSLDRHIEKIKELRSNYLIFSAGSSITSLLANDITPDLHVEIESDYLTYKKLSESKYHNEIRKIPLCAAVQCSPFLFDFFEQSVAFFKEELPSSAVLEPDVNNRLRYATPTCTNTALSIAIHFQAPEVRLIGLDLGYYQLDQHHSKSSVYYDDSDMGKKLSKNMDKLNNEKKNMKMVQGYKGTVFTYWVFDFARKSIERLISITKDTLVINHSDGAVIKDCLREEELTPPKEKINSKASKEAWEDLLTSGKKLHINDLNKLHTKTLAMEDELIEFIQKSIIEPVTDPVDYMSRKSFIINKEIIKLEKKHGKLCMTISGTLRQYIYLGLSLVLMTRETERQLAFANDWRISFRKLLLTIRKETDDIFKQNQASKSEDRLTLSILEPLPE
ncbi:6-hydroxymethylpterin diphosphokinase MptE-like protein [Salinispirillum marinum]|uniref:6-hydroxymethylpterin diphosphokinase MptE-like protein n=2 Tax=Saccharospirillaceae TaxID=255527 RepID=A0ABV8BG24_9GAMM